MLLIARYKNLVDMKAISNKIVIIKCEEVAMHITVEHHVV